LKILLPLPIEIVPPLKAPVNVPAAADRVPANVPAAADSVPLNTASPLEST